MCMCAISAYRMNTRSSVEHGNVDLLRKEVGLDRDTIIAQVLEDLGRESRQITEKDR